MKSPRELEQHLLSLRSQGHEHLTVSIDMLLDILAKVKPQQNTNTTETNPTSIQVDGGDFSDDNW